VNVHRRKKKSLEVAAGLVIGRQEGFWSGRKGSRTSRRRFQASRKRSGSAGKGPGTAGRLIEQQRVDSI
jgi:hypothetical protein